jgi:MFS family permease
MSDYETNDGDAGPDTGLDPDSDASASSLSDYRQLGLFAAIGSLGYVFWVIGGMEMVERLAFYGVKAVAVLYAKEPASSGGLGVDLTTFGTLLMVWAFVQSLLPIFTGGLSDRYGYKETIFISTVLKILGYLIMAWFPTYAGFFVGAIVLATGTAIFKPGIQGTLVKVTDRRNSSMAWGIFYQTVNIGGFLGPLVAAFMRSRLGWDALFYVCAGIISLNFLLLCTYREVGKAERLELNRKVRAGEVDRPDLVRDSLRELLRPHVWTYLLLFSGFWFMFMALFDVLPAHIDDWVDTRVIVETVSPSGPVENPVLRFLFGMNPEGTEIMPEGLLNINAGLIMLTCFFFAHISGLMRATTSMVVGTLFATGSMMVFGSTTFGWAVFGAICIFSIGEMLSSPKFSEFIGNFAPTDKKAMYLGFSQVPVAIGWTLEGKIGPMLYDVFASKDRFARELLAERLGAGTAALPAGETLDEWSGRVQMTPAEMSEMAAGDAQAFVEAIPQGEAFDWLVIATGEAAETLQATLAASHSIGAVWHIMAIVGAVSAMGIWVYGKWVRTLHVSNGDGGGGG